MSHRFEDFTEKNYTRLLQYAKKRYIFIDYTMISEPFAKETILWRHDVDFSVHRAYALSQIEHNLDIKSTFFLQLSCEFYNIFEKEIKDLIQKMIRSGHHMGVHFDPTLYNIVNKTDLEKYLGFEKNILENLLNIEIKVFSFHNPTPGILKYNELKYAGLINTYAQDIQNRFEYCSDSNGYWRFKRLEDFLKDENISDKQVLTHPAWWQKEIMSPFDRIKRCIEGRAQKRIIEYEKNLKEHGRKNIKGT